MRKSAVDLAVAYRIYPGVSKTPALHADDKLRLAELCLRSFRSALGDLRVRVWALLDGCPSSFEDLFHRYFDPDHLEIVRLDGIGNQATFLRQTDILLQQQASERVYFAEDDYFYLPGALVGMIDLLDRESDVDFVTPYDHPDFYQLAMHRYRREMRMVEGRHWQTVGGTPLTFLTSRTVLRKTAPVFRSYGAGNHDASLWFALTKYRVRQPLWLLAALRRDPLAFRLVANAWRYSAWEILFGRRRRLWAPAPSLATHMESCYLAPAVDWRSWFERAEEIELASAGAEPRRESGGRV
jgi:hypothetical protein